MSDNKSEWEDKRENGASVDAKELREDYRKHLYAESVSAPAQEVKRYDMDRLLNAAWVSGAKVGANCIEADNRKALNEAISAHAEGACGKDYVLFSAYASLSAQLAAAKQEGLNWQTTAHKLATDCGLQWHRAEALESTNTVLRSALRVTDFKNMDFDLLRERVSELRLLAALQGETK